MKGTLGFKSFKRPLQPKISEKQRESRLRFSNMVKDWPKEDFEKVIWRNECFFELIHPLNPQNDRVLAKNREKVPQNGPMENGPILATHSLRRHP